jgi:hypothetical protein
MLLLFLMAVPKLNPPVRENLHDIAVAIELELRNGIRESPPHLHDGRILIGILDSVRGG